MNANELADGILAIEERIFLTKKEHQLFQNSAAMLRQQQAEIEALKAEIVSIEKNTDYWADKANWIKPNKPVAYVSTTGLNDIEWTDASHSLNYGDALYTHPIKEHFEDEPQAEELHEIMQSNTHPVKELHLSLQKSKQTGELLAVTYTDDEHRIVEVLWQKSPVKELTDEEITELKNALKGSEYKTYPSKKQWESYLVLEKYAERLLRKAQNV